MSAVETTRHHAPLTVLGGVGGQFVEHPSLLAALAAFGGEDGLTFPKTKTARVTLKAGGSYTYKYADLGDILPAVRPLLAKHGLSWTSKPALDASGEMVLLFTLAHACGECDAGSIPLGVPKGSKPQELGSAITYARRYAITAQLNLATEEDDDDASAAQSAPNAAIPSDAGPPPGSQPTARPAAPSERPASAKQKSMIDARAAVPGLRTSELANAILRAAGEPQRTWESESAAGDTLRRLTDRLPARLVDAVLEEIARVSNDRGAA